MGLLQDLQGMMQLLILEMVVVVEVLLLEVLWGVMVALV